MHNTLYDRLRAAPWLALLLASTTPPPPDAAQYLRTLDRYREMTSVSTQCSQPQQGDEITVCGRRHDEYRLDRHTDPKSFVSSKDNVRSERSELLKDHSQSRCGMAATLSGCGSAGVTVRIGM